MVELDVDPEDGELTELELEEPIWLVPEEDDEPAEALLERGVVSGAGGTPGGKPVCGLGTGACGAAAELPAEGGATPNEDSVGLLAAAGGAPPDPSETCGTGRAPDTL